MLLYSGILAYDIFYIGTLATVIGVLSGLFQKSFITMILLLARPSEASFNNIINNIIKVCIKLYKDTFTI